MDLTPFTNYLAVDSHFSHFAAEVKSGQRSDFLIHDGFLFKGNQLCVPESSLRLKIIKELHEGGHVGSDKTLQLVASSYFWPSMRKELPSLWMGVASAKCQRDQQQMQDYTRCCQCPVNHGLMLVWILFWDCHVLSGVVTPST